MNDRLPPQSVEAEQSLLGSILLMPNCLDEVAHLVCPESFYSDAHARIFRHAQELHNAGKSVDAVTVHASLAKSDEIDDTGGADYLSTVLESVPHAGHAVHYAEIVREKWQLRELVRASGTIAEDCYSGDTAAEVISRSEAAIYSVAEQSASEQGLSLADSMIGAFKEMEKRWAGESSPPVLSGFTDFDRQMQGFRGSQLVILAARPSMGKTACVCNLALNAAKDGNGILLFSLEQGQQELIERLLAMQSKISSYKLREGDLTEFESFRVKEATRELSDLPVFIDDNAYRNVTQIGSIARRIKRKHGLSAVVIDYIQLIQPEDGRQPREQQVATISRRLKGLAKELDIPVIALAQLNRQLEQRKGDDQIPRMSDLRESGALEQDADVIWFLHRPEQLEPGNQKGKACWRIAKNRNGPTFDVWLTWLKETMRFADMASPMERALEHAMSDF